MRYVVIAISLLNGLWMLIDGVYVLSNGKYIGPERPGPWASVLGATGIDVFKLGPVFVLYGIAWLAFAGGMIANVEWAKYVGILLSVLTLWYLPFGTLISLVVLASLMFVIER